MIANQIEIDFEKAEADRAITEQIERNMKADAHNWTTEGMAKSWCGIRDWEEWLSLPKYERDRIIRLYEWEQADLEWLQSQWEPLAEIFYPDGMVGVFPRKPFRIRDYRDVEIRVDPEEIRRQEEAAQRMADQLSRDWSANRPPSVFTYDPFLASSVSLILGRKIEAILPPEEHKWYVPIVWQLITALERERRL